MEMTNDRRPQEVVDRDEQVVKLLKGRGRKSRQLSVLDIAEALDITRDDAYRCVWRLRRADRVEKVPTSGTRQSAWQLR